MRGFRYKLEKIATNEILRMWGVQVDFKASFQREFFLWKLWLQITEF